jgi:hypothetical protein
MYVLFEEGGKFLAARVMSAAESSMQVEMDSGKRSCNLSNPRQPRCCYRPAN